MEKTIKVISGNEKMGQCEMLNKLKAEQRILELFETEEIEKIEEMIDFEDWQKTDQTTYFEFFKLNRMGDYLNKEQRQRILDVARVMFPNAEKGLYTEEITQRQKEEP